LIFENKGIPKEKLIATATDCKSYEFLIEKSSNISSSEHRQRAWNKPTQGFLKAIYDGI
jgi:hypothetical protein